MESLGSFSNAGMRDPHWRGWDQDPFLPPRERAPQLCVFLVVF